MVTYVGSDADVKNFNTWALSMNRTMKQKESSINRQIAYLEQVYRSYVKHYNELQDLQKQIDSLTGESKYTTRDYSYYPEMNISSTFNVSFGNARLVNKGGSLEGFKNCIEDVRKSMIDVQVEVREVYNKVIRDTDPYGSMYKKTNDIRSHGSSIATNVAVNVSTSLSEGEITQEQYQEMKDRAEKETEEKHESIEKSDVTPVTPEGPSKEDLEKEAEEAAKEAAEKAFNEEQNRLDKAATDAANKANEANNLASKYEGSWESHTNGTDSNWSYTDPTSGESFRYNDFGSGQTAAYGDGTKTVMVTEKSDGTYEVYDGGTKTTYGSKEEAVDAANKAAGKDVFDANDYDMGAANAAGGTYDSNKEKAESAADKANQDAKDAADKAKEHKESGSSDSSGGV